MTSLTDFFTSQPGLMIAIIVIIVLIIGITILKKGTAFLRHRGIRNRLEQLDPRKITIQDIDEMEGAVFERYLHRLFRELGYEDAYKTQDSGDFGADLVFTDRLDTRNVLQAKRYQESSTISLDAVQQVFSSMRYYRSTRAIVLTSAPGFTASCETLASVNGVKLLARDELIEIIQAFKAGKYAEAMDIIESEAYTELTPWKDYLNTPLHHPKKDQKAEKWLRSR